MRKNIGIILAGGSGQRMGNTTPKQFLIVAGKTILEHTVNVFQDNRHIDEIAIVANPDYHEVIRNYINRNQFTKVVHILRNGPERYHSTLSALAAYKNTDCNLLIHDAVRPLVTHRIIDEVIHSLQEYNAVNVAIPATDTIIEVDESHSYIARIPERSLLYHAQTPQGFNRNILQCAFDKALQDADFKTTDDCGVVKKYLPTERIKIVTGDISNIKITWPEDLAIAERLLSSLSIL